MGNIKYFKVILSIIRYYYIIHLREGLSMRQIKKSLNITPDMAQRLDDFIQKNPGINFTLIANQAIEEWLKNPVVKLRPVKKVSNDDIRKMIEEDKELMEDLAK